MGAAVHPRPCQGAIGYEKTAVRQARRVQRPPVQPYCSDDTGRHVGAGCARRPSISCRISANSHRGIATSASVTYRPCRTALAPILISLDRRCRSSPQRGWRLVLNLIGQGQRPKDVAQVARQSVQLKPHFVVTKAVARQPGPVDGVLAFLDPLSAVPR